MSEITKGEWWIQVWNEGSSYESVHINPALGANDFHAVATLSGPDAKANARHIVHCVNNHERLVEALREARGQVVELCQTKGVPLPMASMKRYDTLLAALEAEKGGEL